MFTSAMRIRQPTLALKPRRDVTRNPATVLRPVYTECLRLRRPLTPMMDENAFYLELYRKTQALGVNGPLQERLENVLL